MPILRPKRNRTACLAMLSQLTFLAIGCGGSQSVTTQPTLTLTTGSDREQPLDKLEALVESDDFDAAAAQLKNIEFGSVPPVNQDQLAYLTARISLARTPQAGCRQMSSYAQTTTSTLRKSKATQLAISCLKAPSTCPKIENLSRSFITNLVEMTRRGLLEKRLRCGALEEVVDALVDQQQQFSRDQPTTLQGAEQILAVLDGKKLKALAPRLEHNALLQQQVRLRLLTHFLPSLSESEQSAFISSLPKSHPVRIEWETSPRGNIVLICLPLTGNFGTLGQMVRTQLLQLQTIKPALFNSRLEFFDCTDESWSAEAFDKALNTLGARFVLSLTDGPLQARLSKHLGNAPQITHFTLNPIFPGTVSAHNTWTLNVSPDLLIGTLVTDALTSLKRKKMMPLPVRILLITSPQKRSPVHRYLEQYARSFEGFKALSVPGKCDEGMSTKACSIWQQQKWVAIAKNVVRLTRGNAPFDIVYLDLEPNHSVSFLKYVASAKTGSLTSPREHQPPTSERPIVYADHRPLQVPETQFSLRPQGGDLPKRMLRNRYTRLSGQYSNGLRYLVHFNPLSKPAFEYITAVTSVLGKPPRPEVTTLLEALRLMDALTQAGRRQDADNIDEPMRATVFQQGHTSGLSVSPNTRTLPRLSILVTEDGYFIER
jgi:hypothetical protein